MLKISLFVIVSLLALSGCASQPSAPPSYVCPKPPPVPAWILEPQPNLIPLLDQLITPYEKVSPQPKKSSQPVNPN